MNVAGPWVEPTLVIAAGVALIGLRLYLGVSQLHRSDRWALRIIRRERAMHKGHDAPLPDAWTRMRNAGLATLIVPGAGSLVLLAIYVYGGRYQFYRHERVDYLVASISYPIGSALLGAIVGLGKPWMRGFVRSSLVVMAALTPLIVGIALSMDNALTHWDTFDTALCVGMIVIYGMAGGYGSARGERLRAMRGKEARTISRERT
jgi:hypothetical protein